MPALEQAVFDSNDSEPLRASLRRWALGLLFDQEFAKAVFGDEHVDCEDGSSLLWLRLWAKQTHYEVLGKLYEADRSRPYYSFILPQETEMYDKAKAIAEEVIPTQTITLRLEDMYGSLAVPTHKIQEPRVEGGIPSWQWHIKQMAVADNPFTYISDYIEKNEKITD